MDSISFALFLMGAVAMALRAALFQHNLQELERLRREDMEKFLAAVAANPNNASAHASLGEMYFKEGRIGFAIHEYRTAISISPQGPFATKWKRALKEALGMQEFIDAGKPVPGFHSFRVCHQCHADVNAAAKKCPKCEAELDVGVVEWTLRPENRNDIIKNTVVVTGLLLAGSVIFSILPIEVKGVLLVSTVLVSYWLFLRSFGV